MNIWTYWEGPKPLFIDLCLKSMQRAFRKKDFHIVTPETLYNYISPNALHGNYHNLLQVISEGNRHMLAAMRTGCIRAALLAAHGGWWFDADTIGINSPRYLNCIYEEPSVIYTVWSNSEKPTRVLNGYIYMTQDSAAEWLQRLNWKLEHEFNSIKWCTLGEGILTPLIMGQGPESYRKAVRIPRRLVLPVDVDSNVEAFFKPGDPDTYLSPGTVCFGLNYSYMLYWHRKQMAPPWDQDLMIHRLLRQTKERIG